jgi:integrase
MVLRDIIPSSPCHPIKLSGLIPDLPKPRDRVLTDDELRLVWRAAWPADATAEDVYPLGPYIRLLMILGCRRSELAKATWRGEIDLVAATWTLPGERTKNGDPRLIPLCELAVDILTALPRFSGPYVFSTTAGTRPLANFDAVKRVIDRRITALNGGQGIGNWRLHDLRRTMRTRLSALAILPIVSELMIGHRQGGVQAIYNLHTYEAEQRDGFEAWSAKLLSIVEPGDATNVVAMRPRP